MRRSHKPLREANTRGRIPLDEPARSPHQEEGPADARAPEAFAKVPSEPEPTARDPQEPPGSPPSPFFQEHLDLRDPEHVRRWLHAMRESLADLVAVAREGARRPRNRVLARAEMKRQARAAEESLVALLDMAQASLIASP